MKPFLSIVTLLSVSGLLACRPAGPPDITRMAAGETAVAATPPPTWTPSPTIISTTTVTAVPTWTPDPAPTAVTNPTTPTQQQTTGQALPINNDLLFINDGELQIWQPQTGQVTTLLAQTESNMIVNGWRTTPDGQSVLIAQTPDNDQPGFTLFLFQATTRLLQELWSESDTYLFAYALAVDGRSVALITGTTSSQTGEGVETVQLINSESGQASKLTDCPNSRQLGNETNSFTYTLRCQSLVAAPDGRTWLWRDIEGVWQGGREQAPRLLVAHDFFEEDLPRIYSPTTDWSPDGRYQLLSAQRFEGSNRWVLDMTTGQTIAVPNSVTGLDKVAYWQWTPDNHLFTVRPPIYINGETDNVAELWQIAGNELVAAASLALPDLEGVPPAAPSQLGDGRFAFILNHTAAIGSLYLITSFEQPPQPLVNLPLLSGFWDSTHRQSLTWTPDARGVLYSLPTADTRQLFYIPDDNSTLYDLTPLLGSNITSLLWLP